eukprot:3934401-Rhodomonas_salina.1
MGDGAPAAAAAPCNQARRPATPPGREGCKKRNSTSCHDAARTMVRGNELLGEHFDEARQCVRFRRTHFSSANET